MPLNTAVMFGKATDEWATPQAFFDVLDEEFRFEMDVAATRENALCDEFYDADSDALRWPWANDEHQPTCWMNPPYSKCREFIAKAAEEARKGCTVVALVPSRTDTRWWHAHIWDVERNQPRPGVEVRFLKGRLKFGNSTNSAPFPSVVIVFRPVESGNVHDAVDPVERPEGAIESAPVDHARMGLPLFSASEVA